MEFVSTENLALLAERRKTFVELFRSAPIIKTFGMSLQYDDQQQAVVELPYNPAFDHALGGTHGGVIAMMLDTAGWFTVAPYYGSWIATVEFHVRLLEPATGQALRATGKLIRIGKRLAVAEMEVRSADKRLIARGSGTFSLTSVPIRLSQEQLDRDRDHELDLTHKLGGNS